MGCCASGPDGRRQGPAPSSPPRSSRKDGVYHNKHSELIRKKYEKSPAEVVETPEKKSQPITVTPVSQNEKEKEVAVMPPPALSLEDLLADAENAVAAASRQHELEQDETFDDDDDEEYETPQVTPQPRPHRSPQRPPTPQAGP
eukprot:Sspe_Gene.88730::Locus_60673_Transcript_1_1_Confidence_1.000_Length_609::g.88730::m.88730